MVIALSKSGASLLHLPATPTTAPPTPLLGTTTRTTDTSTTTRKNSTDVEENTSRPASESSHTNETAQNIEPQSTEKDVQISQDQTQPPDNFVENRAAQEEESDSSSGSSQNAPVTQPVYNEPTAPIFSELSTQENAISNSENDENILYTPEHTQNFRPEIETSEKQNENNDSSQMEVETSTEKTIDAATSQPEITTSQENITTSQDNPTSSQNDIMTSQQDITPMDIPSTTSQDLLRPINNSETPVAMVAVDVVEEERLPAITESVIEMYSDEKSFEDGMKLMENDEVTSVYIVGHR